MASPSRSTILVVDDDPDLRGSLAEVLRNAGYAVATAHDGSSALVVLQAIAADLILVDLTMPGMGGLEFLERWSAEPRSGGPVVLMTGGDGVGVPAPDHVTMLAKPFSVEHLLDVVQRSVAHQPS